MMATPFPIHPVDPLPTPVAQPIPGISTVAPVNDGVLSNDLLSLGIGLARPKRGVHLPSGGLQLGVTHTLKEASFEDTAARLKGIYLQILKKHESLHDFLNLDSSVPTNFDIEHKRELYQFSDGTDGYPPHLVAIPPSKDVPTTDIFHESAWFYAQLALMMEGIFPSQLATIHGAPWNTFRKNTLAGLQETNVKFIKGQYGIWTANNVGQREDWYTDKHFAQQHLTGPNPTTIQLASANWIGSFKQAAQDQSQSKFLDMIENAEPNSIYLQDYSYFRLAAGVQPSDDLTSEDTFKFGQRFVGASVILFHLGNNGILHPLAIVVDYKENDIVKGSDGYFQKSTINSMSNSVAIFNERQSANDPDTAEATDWPWRYAKMCVQVADWHRHEVGIHLVHTHLIEEATIVGVERSFDNAHMVHQLLSPHWLKTLPLNHAARSTLVPGIIFSIAGMDKQHLSNYLNSEYDTFHWEDLYIPNDLTRRGFPLADLSSEKYINYPYGQNVLAMWFGIRKFVNSMLTHYYEEKGLDVANDVSVQDWYQVMQADTAGARLATFPTITTLDQLVDAVTMCIHTACPQHNAVNYLQEYYQVFVPNKPSCLAAPLPQTLQDLQSIQEKDIINTLPLSHGNVWLMSAYIPHLLSMTVADDQNIVSYARSALWYWQQKKDQVAVDAVSTFIKDLLDMEDTFLRNSNNMTVQTGIENVPNYVVMDPRQMAVSILI